MDHIRQLQPQARVIVDSVDLHFLRLERQVRYLETQVKYSVNSSQERSPLGESFAKELQDHRNYAAHVKEHELRAYGKCDQIVVASADDEQELRRHLPHAEIVLAPNVYEPRRSPVPGSSGRKGVVFVGNFDHGPNSSAAIYLKHEIAPVLAERIGELPLRIVGNNPPYLVRNMATKGPCAAMIEVTGHVADTATYLEIGRAHV